MKFCDVIAAMKAREGNQQAYRRRAWDDDVLAPFSIRADIVEVRPDGSIIGPYVPAGQDLSAPDWYVVTDPINLEWVPGPDSDPEPDPDDLVCLVKQELTTKVQSGGCTVDELLEILAAVRDIQ
jgi:hypothetical protein